MKRVLIFVVMLLTATAAWASFQAFNGNSDLKVFNKIRCSTGLLCTRVGDRLNIVATGATDTIAGAEGANADLTLAADEGDDNGDAWVIRSAASGNSLVFLNDVSGSAAAKMTLSTSGGLSGYNSPLVQATATTITAAQCGSTFYNAGAVEMELPEASTVLGCTLTFVVLNGSDFHIDPDNADVIVYDSASAGDRLVADAVGETITIRALSASQWVVLGVNGTWTDAN